MPDETKETTCVEPSCVNEVQYPRLDSVISEKLTQYK